MSEETRVTAPEHYWGHEVAALTLDDEMESIELGDRVLYEFTLEGMAALYTDEWARIRTMEVVLHHRLKEHKRVSDTSHET